MIGKTLNYLSLTHVPYDLYYYVTQYCTVNVTVLNRHRL